MTPDFTLAWVAETFGLGRPTVAVPGGRGQKNPLGVLRLDAARGRFAVKRLERQPAGAALAVERAAWSRAKRRPAHDIGGQHDPAATRHRSSGAARADAAVRRSCARRRS